MFERIEIIRRVRVILEIHVGVEVLLELQHAPDVERNEAGRDEDDDDLHGCLEQRRSVELVEKHLPPNDANQLPIGRAGCPAISSLIYYHSFLDLYLTVYYFFPEKRFIGKETFFASGISF